MPPDAHAGDIWSMISGGAALVALLLSIWNSLTAKGRKEFDEMVETSKEHGDRLTKVEDRLDHVPQIREIHELKVAMADLTGKMAVIVERVEPIKAIADRLQQVMLERH